MLMNRVPQQAINALVVSLLYLTAMLVVRGLSTLENTLNPYSHVASLLFLPHGIRVLATLVFGSKAGFFYIFCAACVSQIILGDFSYERGFLSQFFALLIGAASAPLAFFLVSFSIGRDITYLAKPNPQSWRVLILVTMASAAINSFGQTAVSAFRQLELPALNVEITFFLGDTLGTLVVFLAVYLLIRVAER